MHWPAASASPNSTMAMPRDLPHALSSMNRMLVTCGGAGGRGEGGVRRQRSTLVAAARQVIEP